MADIKSMLFPTSYVCGFTTCPAVTLPGIKDIQLTDASLCVHKIAGGTTHRIVTPPAPQSRLGNPPDQAYEAFYPQGGLNPRANLPSGFSFYVSGPEWFREGAKKAREVLWSYRVMLEKDWEGANGGKLPGVFGGVGGKAYGCSDGRKEDRCQCFSLRLMWRPNNIGEIYAYVPLLESNVTSLLSAPPFSVQNPDYGISVGRGAFRFVPGTWTAICIRLKLNRIGEQDGEVELYVDGASVVHATGLTFQTPECREDVKIMGLQFVTFFGGHTPPWASPKDQRAWFADISAAIIE